MATDNWSIRADFGSLHAAMAKVIALQTKLVAAADKQISVMQQQVSQGAKLEESLRGQNKEIDAQKKKTSELLISWESLGRLAIAQTARASLHALTDALRDATATALEFEKQIAAVQTIDKSQAPFQAYVAGLRELSDRSAIDIVDQTKAAYQALSNQVADGVETFGFLREANDLALVGMANAEETVNLLSSAINAFGLPVSETRTIAASFFKTVELGRNTIKEMSGDFGRLAVPASQLGVSLNEVQAAIATITVKGVKFNVASTFLRNTLLKLTKPGEELAQFIRELGFETGEAAIKALGLGGVLRAVEDRAKGSSTEIASLFQNIRAIAGATVFAGDGLKQYDKNLERIGAATDTYGAKVKLVTQNAGKQFEIAANKIKNIFTIESALPALIKVGQLTDGFNIFVVAAEKARNVLGAIAGAAIPLLIVGLKKLIISVFGALGGFLQLHPAIFVITAISAAIGILIAQTKSLEEQNNETYLAAVEVIRKVEEAQASTLNQLKNESVAGYKKATKQMAASIGAVIGAYVKLRNEGKKLDEEVGAATTKANEASLKSVDNLIAKAKLAQKANSKASQEEKKIQEEIADLTLERSLVGKDDVGKLKVLSFEVGKLNRLREQAFKAGDVDAFKEANIRLNKVLADRRGAETTERGKKQAIDEIIAAKKRELIINKQLVEEVAKQKEAEIAKLNVLINQRETLKTQFDAFRDFDPAKLEGDERVKGFETQLERLKEIDATQKALGLDRSNTAKEIARTQIKLDRAVGENQARIFQATKNTQDKIVEDALKNAEELQLEELKRFKTFKNLILAQAIASKTETKLVPRGQGTFEEQVEFPTGLREAFLGSEDAVVRYSEALQRLNESPQNREAIEGLKTATKGISFNPITANLSPEATKFQEDLRKTLIFLKKDGDQAVENLASNAASADSEFRKVLAKSNEFKAVAAEATAKASEGFVKVKTSVESVSDALVILQQQMVTLNTGGLPGPITTPSAVQTIQPTQTAQTAVARQPTATVTNLTDSRVQNITFNEATVNKKIVRDVAKEVSKQSILKKATGETKIFKGTSKKGNQSFSDRNIRTGT